MHIIRLHGPWDYQPLAGSVVGRHGGTGPSDGESLPPPGRVTPPCDWTATLGAGFRGRVRYSRRFHAPTGLERSQRVFLAIERVDAYGVVILNGERLGEVSLRGGPFRFDVTERLRPDDLLTIEVEWPHGDDGDSLSGGNQCKLGGGLIGYIRLEIEEPT